MNFEVGKKVIAVCDNDDLYKRGQVFTLKRMRDGFCKCSPVLLDIGIHEDENTTMRCEDCGAHLLTVGTLFAACDFLPYDDSLSEMTVEQVMREASRELAEAPEEWVQLSL